MNCKLRTDKQVNFISLMENFRSTCAHNKELSRDLTHEVIIENVCDKILRQ